MELAKVPLLDGVVAKYGVARTYRAIKRVFGYHPMMVATHEEAISISVHLEQENLKHAIPNW